MTRFNDISDEELRAELEQRERAKCEAEKPRQLATIEVDKLKKVCQEYIDELYENGYADDDFPHYIYEAAMETVFGKDVWTWINRQRER